MRPLVTIFAASKSYCENFNTVSTENLRYTFIIHRRSSNCGEMFADSSGKFQVNVRHQVRVRFNLSNGQQKGQAQWIYIHWLRRCCWVAKSLTRSQSGWRQRALPNKTLDKFKSFQGACWQIRKNITACETRFQHFDLLWYCFDLLWFQNIPARRHRYLKCWQHVVNAPNISQSYFCVVRATHNSNSWA